MSRRREIAVVAAAAAAGASLAGLGLWWKLRATSLPPSVTTTTSTTGDDGWRKEGRAAVMASPLFRHISSQEFYMRIPFHPPNFITTANARTPAAAAPDADALKLEALTERYAENAHEDTEDAHQHSLMRGSLYGKGKIEHSTGFYDARKRELITITKLGDKICGHPGLVHGGMIAAMFDDFMGMAFFLSSDGEYSGFTANLNVDYRTPMPANDTIALIAWVERMDGRKVFLKAETRSIPPSIDPSKPDGVSPAERILGPGSVKYAECSALFIIPKAQYEAWQKRLASKNI